MANGQETQREKTSYGKNAAKKKLIMAEAPAARRPKKTFRFTNWWIFLRSVDTGGVLESPALPGAGPLYPAADQGRQPLYDSPSAQR